MAFVESLLGSFVFWLILFGLVFLLSLVIGVAIRKKKVQRFQTYIGQNFSDIAPDQAILVAKQKSKQIRPDIVLIMPAEQEKIILITDNKDEGMAHHIYDFGALIDVETTNQIISRGFAPKTFSYEETLHLIFSDGAEYCLILENVSNKHGTDQGADAVREMFRPWREQLMQALNR